MLLWGIIKLHSCIVSDATIYHCISCTIVSSIANIACATLQIYMQTISCSIAIHAAIHATVCASASNARLPKLQPSMLLSVHGPFCKIAKAAAIHAIISARAFMQDCQSCNYLSKYLAKGQATTNPAHTTQASILPILRHQYVCLVQPPTANLRFKLPQQSPCGPLEHTPCQIIKATNS